MYRVQGTLREWVTRDEVRRFISKKFKDFLLTYVNPKSEQGDFEYVRLINEMVLGKFSIGSRYIYFSAMFLSYNVYSAANKCSLEIDYKQFIYILPNIAIWLADAPHAVLEVMEEVAQNVVFDFHKNYRNIHQKIYVRITNLPVYDQIRNIRYSAVVQNPFIFFFKQEKYDLLHVIFQADPFEHNDSNWGCRYSKIWGFSSAATGEIRL